ncbi:MAG: glycosyltransferase family 39 protein [Chloroflexi bacterium]|nr:glycosyltransferase family 39 protein [Chloroflexota bacterium]
MNASGQEAIGPGPSQAEGRDVCNDVCNNEYNKEGNSFLLAVVIIAAGILLRFLFLGRNGFWVDEAYSVWVAGKPLKEILSFLMVHEPHPPLFYFVLQWWQAVLGHAGIVNCPEWLYRLPFAAASALALIPFYFISLRLLGKRLAICALFFWAFSSSEIIIAQQVRMYPLLSLFAVLSVLYYLKMREEGKVLDSAAYCLFTALMLYTHYMGIFVFIAQLADFLLTVRKGEWRKLAATTLIVVAAYLPWVHGFIAQVFLNKKIQPAISPITLQVIPGTYVSLFYGFASQVKIHLVFWLMFAFILFFMLRAFWKSEQRLRPVLLGVIVFLPVILLGALAVLPTKIFFSSKHVIMILPFLIMLVIAGTRGNNRLLAALLIVFVLTNGISLERWYLNPEYQMQRWRDAVSVYKEYRRPGDLVIIMNPSQVFAFKYYEKDEVPLYLPEAGWKEKDVISIISNHKRVWIFSTYGWSVDPQNRIGSIVGERGDIILALRLKNSLDTSGDTGIILAKMRKAETQKGQKF